MRVVDARAVMVITMGRGYGLGMNRRTSSIVVVVSLAVSTGCTGSISPAPVDASPGGPTDAASADAVSGSDGSEDGEGLRWYLTCGYPVCHAPMPDAGTPDAEACPPVGSPCAADGATCGTPDDANCGAILECTNQNPATECPISSRSAKDGIRYADEAALSRLHDETLGIRLATYTYKPDVADPKDTHLGFIIEDNSQLQAVNGARNRVDLYGYVSMVVASMQVQEKEIVRLRSELEAVRKKAVACREARR